MKALHILAFAAIFAIVSSPISAQSLDELITQVRKLKFCGKYEEAIPLARKAIELSESRAEDVPHFYACRISDLGDLYRKNRDFSDAETHYEKALNLIEKHFGDEDRRIIQPLWDLAELYSDTIALMAAFYDRVLAGKHPARARPAVQREALTRLRAERGLWHAINRAAPFVIVTNTAAPAISKK